MEPGGEKKKMFKSQQVIKNADKVVLEGGLN